MKILLVDDHAVVRHGYASLLSASLPEVEIAQASSGEDALQCMPTVNPHLVIMDIGLPGISGLETCRRLRQRLPQLSVLFFSSTQSTISLSSSGMPTLGSGHISFITSAPDSIELAER